MSRSHIAFDGGDSSDDSSLDNTTMNTTTRSRASRSRTAIQTTPRSSRRPGPIRRTVNGSPQPGPSSRVSDSTSSSTTNTTGRRKKQANPRATNAIREIVRLQYSTKLLVPRTAFCRVVREVLHEFGGNDLRMQSLALEALQEATEMYVVQFLEDAYRCTMHRNQVTLKPSDLTLVRTLRGGLL